MKVSRATFLLLPFLAALAQADREPLANGSLVSGGELWYAVDVDSGRWIVDLEALIADSRADLDLEAYSEEGDVLAQSLSSGARERIKVEVEGRRRLRLRVSHRGGPPADFRLSQQQLYGYPPLPAGERIRRSVGPANRRDSYVLSLGRGQYRVSVTPEVFECGLGLQLRSGRSVIGQAGGEGGPAELRFDLAAPLSLELRVELKSEQLGSAYSLVLDSLGALPVARETKSPFFLSPARPRAALARVDPERAWVFARAQWAGTGSGRENGVLLGAVDGPRASLVSAEEWPLGALLKPRADTAYFEVGLPAIPGLPPEEGVRRGSITFQPLIQAEGVKDRGQVATVGPTAVPYFSTGPGVLEVSASAPSGRAIPMAIAETSGRRLGGGWGAAYAPLLPAGTYAVAILAEPGETAFVEIRRESYMAEEWPESDAAAPRLGQGSQGAAYIFIAKEDQAIDLVAEIPATLGRAQWIVSGSDHSRRLSGRDSTPRMIFNVTAGATYALQLVVENPERPSQPVLVRMRRYGISLDGPASAEDPRPPKSAEGGPKVFGVFAGVGDYRDADDLLFAPRDAASIAAALVDGGLLDPDRAVLLIDERASAEAFANALRELASKARPGDLSIVFFSGHGDVSAPDAPGAGPLSEKAWICLWDVGATFGFRGGVLGARSLTDLVAAIPGDRILWIDACFSGAFEGPLREKGGSLQAILSSEASRRSREGINLEAGILAHQIEKSLRGAADANRDGKVSASEVENFVSRTLPLGCLSCNAFAGADDAFCPNCQRPFTGSSRPQMPVSVRALLRDPTLAEWPLRRKP